MHLERTARMGAKRIRGSPAAQRSGLGSQVAGRRAGGALDGGERGSAVAPAPRGAHHSRTREK